MEHHVEANSPLCDHDHCIRVSCRQSRRESGCVPAYAKPYMITSESLTISFTLVGISTFGLQSSQGSAQGCAVHFGSLYVCLVPGWCLSSKLLSSLYTEPMQGVAHLHDLHNVTIHWTLLGKHAAGT